MNARYLTPLLLSLGLVPLASAQNLSADEVLAQLEARTESLQDLSFLVTGTLFDADGQEIALEVEVQFIPAEELARSYFIQPDALADNFIIADGDTVYNYLFTTNQVSILRADDPEALGGLLPEAEGEARFSLTPDLGRLFESYEATVEGYEAGVYTLRFRNPEVSEGFVTAAISEAQWLPERLEFVQRDGTLAAELNFQDYVIDSGLDPAELRFIPPDAERIDER